MAMNSGFTLGRFKRTIWDALDQILFSRVQSTTSTCCTSAPVPKAFSIYVFLVFLSLFGWVNPQILLYSVLYVFLYSVFD